MSSRQLPSALKMPAFKAHTPLPASGLVGLAGMLVLMVLLILLPRPDIFTSVAQYLIPHSLLEIGAVLVASMAAISIFQGHRSTVPVSFVVMGCAFLLSAFFDLIHIFSYDGMPNFVSDASVQKAIHFWLAGRTAFVVALLAPCLITSRPMTRRRLPLAFVLTLVIGLLVSWVGLYHLDYLPATFIPGSGLTAWKIGYEWVLAIGSLIAAILLLSSRRLPEGTNISWLAVAALATGLSELCFTLYATAHDVFNLLGHLYKVAAYGMLYHAIYSSRLVYPYQRLKDMSSALAEAEQRWQFALEGSGAGVWDWKQDSDQVFYSPQWKATLGYEEEDIGSSFDEWKSRIHPDDMQRTLEDLKQHFEGHSVEYRNEHRMLTRSGEWKWILDQGRVVERSPDGRPLRMIGTHSDIDWIKEQQQRLITSRARLRSIYHSAPVGIIVADRSGTIVDANSAMHNLLGRGEAELFQQSLWGLFSLEEVSRLKRAWGQLQREGGNFQDEYHMQTARGHLFWAEVTLTPLEGEDRTLVLVNNIEDRRRAIELLEENATLYQEVFSTGNAIKLLIDPELAEIIDANPVAADFYGYSIGEMCGMPLGRINVLASQTLSKRIRSVVNRTDNHFEASHQLANGELRDVEIFTGPVDLNGRTLLFSIVHDITDRKRAQRDLQIANLKLSRLSESRTQIHHLSERLLTCSRLDEIVTQLNVRLPSLFAGCEGTLQLADPADHQQKTHIQWGTAPTEVCVLNHSLSVGDTVIGNFTLQIPSDSESQEHLRPLAEDVCQLIMLALADLQLKQGLAHEARRDTLTRLYNRRHLDEVLPQKLAEASIGNPLSLVVLDLDNFKQVNDTYGHEMGDQVLSRLASIIRESLRSSDEACRYGGEEFVILMPGASAAVTRARVEAILEAFREESFEHDTLGQLTGLSFSAGVANAPHDSQSTDTLFSMADNALYQAKRSGRQRVLCFNNLPPTEDRRVTSSPR